jgi:hypothetical protein
LAAFRTPGDGSFGADGERPVSRTHRVWFRNGGCGGRIGSITASRHQLKIYSESNESDFLQVFAGLTSMQTLSIYRGLLVKD